METALPEVVIYTDGACRGNPGRGGWGAIIVYGQNEKILAGGEEATTNNRMELTAVISALSALNVRSRVRVVSDSRYTVDSINLGRVGQPVKFPALPEGARPGKEGRYRVG